jgi:predicted AAA+ superfamily ATPase
MSPRILERPSYEQQVLSSLREQPIVAVLGPRQCGKTTLARKIAKGTRSTLFDLEDPIAISRLENPMLALEPLRGLVVIDEAQRVPALFPILRVLADRRPRPARFLLLGSVSPELVKGVSESMAGRVAFVEMSGFDLAEVEAHDFKRLWLRGGFPRSYLAASNDSSSAWRSDFATTFLERDIAALGIQVTTSALRRFWMMLAHYHGQIWNAAEFARSLGTSEPTARHYLDVLSGAFMVRQLPPWFENIGKRQVKSPKVYFRDSGLLHGFLSIRSLNDLESHPKLGASWEGFAIEQILSMVRSRDAYFWATHAGAELDLLLFARGRRYGVEVKYADAPKLTPSMRTALLDLGLERLFVVYPGKSSYSLDERVEVVGIQDLISKLGTSLGVPPRAKRLKRSAPKG